MEGRYPRREGVAALDAEDHAPEGELRCGQNLTENGWPGTDLSVLAEADEGEIVGSLGFQARAAESVEAHVRDMHRGPAIGAIEGVAAEKVALGGREAAIAALADEPTEHGATQTNHARLAPLDMQWMGGGRTIGKRSWRTG